MTGAFTESVVEQAALARFESLGCDLKTGTDIAPDMLASELRDRQVQAPGFETQVGSDP